MVILLVLSYFMQDGGVFLVATTRENISPSLVLELLKRIGGIIKARATLICACQCMWVICL